MKIPPPWQQGMPDIQQWVHELNAILPAMPNLADWKQSAQRVSALARERFRILGSPVTELSTFVRPDLSAISPWLHALEPVVAVVGLILLGLLSSVAGLSFIMLMSCGGLILLLLTRVFGLQLDLNT